MRCGLALLHGLAALDVDVRVLAACFPWQRDEAVPATLDAEVVAIPERSVWAVRRERWLHPGDVLARGPFAERLRALAPGFDLVHFLEAEAAVGLEVVERPALAQLNYVSWRDRAPAPIWTQEGRIGRELRRIERRILRQARWLLASAPEVAAALAPLAPGATVAVAPLSLDPRHYAEDGGGLATLAPPVAGLIGTARWPPTASAVDRLLTRIWPRVVERAPEARLLLAGDGMVREAFPDAPDVPGVEWRGRVPSAAGFLRELGVLLYPPVAGSGTKVKVLESLALGVPVVTTPDGAEGIVGRGGLAVEHEDEALVDAAVALLSDVSVRRAAGTAAADTFHRHHAPLPAARLVAELYERIVVERRRD